MISRTLCVAAFAATLALVSAQDYLKCPKASYCIAIDESGSIDDTEHDLFVAGAVAFFKHLATHAPGSYMAAYGFSDTATQISPWTTSVSAITNKLLAYKEGGGDTVLKAGLDACGAALKNAPAPGVVLMMTNGGELKPLTGKAAGDRLRGLGYSVATVGIRLETGDDSLNGIANSKLSITVPKFNQIVSRMEAILHTVCDTLPNPMGMCPSKCPAAAVCFAVDESGSIKRGEFTSQASVLAGITSVFDMLAPASVYAGVGFADEAHTFQSLTFDANTVMNAFLNNKQRKGGSASGAGLKKCAEILNDINGPRMIVLIADGVDNKSPKGGDVDDAIKKSGIAIVTVGIGTEGEKILKNIASPDTGNEYYTGVSAFKVFSQAIGPITGHMCTASAMWKPPPPPSNCGDVICAKCGSQLECYVNSGNSITDSKACEAIRGNAMCKKRKRVFRTRCGQQCASATGSVSCFEGESFGLYVNNPKCKFNDGANVFPSNFAKYNACKINQAKFTLKCRKRLCNSDRKGQQCYPENL